MLIDCDACAAAGPACADCVVTVMLGSAPDLGQLGGVELDLAERKAIAVLAQSGLVPPLRLVRADPQAEAQDAPQREAGAPRRARRAAG